MLIRTVAGTVRVITRLRARWMAFGVIILCVQPSTARILLQELPTCVCRQSELDPAQSQCAAEHPTNTLIYDQPSISNHYKGHQKAELNHYEVKHPGTNFVAETTVDNGVKTIMWDRKYVQGAQSFLPENHQSAVDIINLCAKACDNDEGCVEFIVSWRYQLSQSMCYIAVDGKTAEENPIDMLYFETPEGQAGRQN